MKFTDGFWHVRPGVDAQYAREAYDIDTDGSSLTVSAPTTVIARRGDVLNRALLTVTLDSPLDDTIRVRIEHHTGVRRGQGFELVGGTPRVLGAGEAAATVDADGGTLQAGRLSARIAPGAPWNLSFEAAGRRLTGSGPKSIGYVRLDKHATVTAEPAGVTGVTTTGLAPSETYVHAQLDLGVGELVYGLGERFGPLVKNGQTVEVWNSDGGTSSEQSYKSIPFYLTNRGYGVLINHPEHVSVEVGSEAVERVQFSVPGESLEYILIYGATPAEILVRYTELTGRPAEVPAWSYGLWLSTSFTTDYDEETVTSFIDGMQKRELPLSVFHFDCFWMREFNWTDLEWDARVFPDPEGMLARLHEKELRVSAWINPYIAQRSKLFREATDQGFLVRRATGDVWQWDFWQAGMALIDFTNPEATTWFQGKLRALLEQGVDALKTDFGERIPTDVVWHDGSDPHVMHNLYTQLYNRAVFDVLEEFRGQGDAVLFARSATTGGQQMPVHWGGDNSSSFESMAETLRGGLSLALSGFGFWSHDIGGFEGMPDAEVFKRWVAFGLLSSHSRLHGSTSYRVPWLFDAESDVLEDAPTSAVSVTRRFTRLKLGLMPYLYRAGRIAHERGIPFMRPVQVAFPGDPAVDYLDRQYMVGDDLLVAPVFSASGEVSYYLPAGRWTNYLTGESVDGGSWRHDVHDVTSIPLWVRAGAVIPTGSREDRPDYDYLDGLLLTVFPGQPDGSGIRTTGSVGPGGTRSVVITNPDGSEETFDVSTAPDATTIRSTSTKPWRATLIGGQVVEARGGEVVLRHN